MAFPILLLTMLLQLLAAFLALRLRRFTRESWGWVLVALAMLLMALRRVVTGWETLLHRSGLNLEAWISLGISLLLLLGMIGLESLLQQGRQAEDTVRDARERAEDERNHAARWQEEALQARQRGEAGMQAAELARSMAMAIDQVDMWISTLDLEGRVVAWNHGAERISGYAWQEVQGRSDFWPRLYPDPVDRARYSTKVLSQLLGAGPIRGEESVIHCKDGATKVISWHVSPVYSPEGAVTGSLALGHDVTEFRGAQEHLERIRTLQDLILDNTALGLCLMHGRIFQWANPRAAEILGIPLEQLLGSETRTCFPDEASYQDFDRMAREAIASGRYWEGRTRFRRPDGTLFWVRVVGRVLDPRQPSMASVWLLEDISTKVELENTLVESEERFRGAFEGTRDAMLLLTPKGIFDCNATALKLFGFEGKSEILQRRLDELAPAWQPGGTPSAVALNQRIQEVLGSGPTTFTCSFRHRVAGEFPAEVFLNAFSMGKRRVLLASIQPQRDHRLPEGEDWLAGFRSALEGHPEATLILDARTQHFVYFNRAALAMLRCRLEEVPHLGPEDLSPRLQPDGRESLATSREMNAIALLGGSHRFHWTHRSPHRGDFPVEVTLMALQPGFCPLLLIRWQEISG
nr:PAS domain S-box protein [uncultured Holophaga sp.]